MRRALLAGLLGLFTLASGVLAAQARENTTSAPDPIGLIAQWLTQAADQVECRDNGTDPYARCKATLTRVDDPARVGVSYSATALGQVCFRPADCTGPSTGAGQTGAEADDTPELVEEETVEDNRVFQLCEGPNCVNVDVPGRRLHVFDTNSSEADVWANGGRTPVSVRELCASTNPDYPCSPGQPGGEFVSLPTPE